MLDRETIELLYMQAVRMRDRNSEDGHLPDKIMYSYWQGQVDILCIILVFPTN